MKLIRFNLAQKDFRPYLIWLCAAAFYIYQFVLRISPSLIVDDLMVFFQIEASGVASFTALAMYAYSLMQIPAGILADTFGVRRVLLISIVFCVVGVSLFTSTPVLPLAKAGRVLLGIGSASAFLCVSKISVQWFSPEKRALLLGMTMTMGTLGAFFGNISLSFLIPNLGWKNSLWVTNLIGVLVFVMGYVVIPKEAALSENSLKSQSLGETMKNVFAQLTTLLKNRDVWIYGITALGIYLCISVIADLWGVSFIMEGYKVSKPVAAQRVSLIYVGLCFGSMVLSFVADYFKIRQLLLRLCTGLLLLLASVLIYFSNLPMPILSILFFLIGFMAGGEMLCFAGVCEIVDRKISGTATGLMNCIVMLGGAFIAEQVGVLLDLFWKGRTHSSGIRIYSLLEYQQSLSLLTFVIFLSLIAAIFLPKQHIPSCRKTIQK